jgi:formylglycine-generating enzyme required for sulfatase activity
LALLILFLGGWIVTWLWQKGYNLDQAGLKVKSLFVGIYVEPEIVRVPDGIFRQGDVEGLGEPWRNPVRPVTIKPFAMGKHEVTFEEYDRFAIATGRDLPSDQKWGRGRRPVINVSWDDAKAYAEWLSKQTGTHYRLPTESEWEYAARSGAKQQVWAGTSEESDLEKYAVFLSNSGNQTALVGQKDPNLFGLHDLSGNVWEWVEDCAHSGYRRAPTDGSAWLDADGGHCSLRVVRGGSWDNGPEYLRTSYHVRFRAVFRDGHLGFRLVQDIP